MHVMVVVPPESSVPVVSRGRIPVITFMTAVVPWLLTPVHGVVLTPFISTGRRAPPVMIPSPATVMRIIMLIARMAPLGMGMIPLGLVARIIPLVPLRGAVTLVSAILPVTPTMALVNVPVAALGRRIPRARECAPVVVLPALRRRLRLSARPLPRLLLRFDIGLTRAVVCVLLLNLDSS